VKAKSSLCGASRPQIWNQKHPPAKRRWFLCVLTHMRGSQIGRNERESRKRIAQEDTKGSTDEIFLLNRRIERMNGATEQSIDTGCKSEDSSWQLSYRVMGGEGGAELVGGRGRGGRRRRVPGRGLTTGRRSSCGSSVRAAGFIGCGVRTRGGGAYGSACVSAACSSMGIWSERGGGSSHRLFFLEGGEAVASWIVLVLDVCFLGEELFL
jgi:hypothetical protein